MWLISTPIFPGSWELVEQEIVCARNIGASVHFIPIHIQPYYRDRYGYKPGDHSVAYGDYLRLITLPLNLRITDSAIEHVLEAVSDFIEKNRR